MAKRQIFYSFHFQNDVMRVQQIRNIGAIEGNSPVSVNKWEEIKRCGNAAIKKWIDDNMKYKSCVVVLVGKDTAHRPWVRYEIEKAWNEGKGIVGIRIHNIRCPRTATCIQGLNPFDYITLQNGRKLSSYVTLHNPNQFNAYLDISNNIENWIEQAIQARKPARSLWNL